MKTCNWNLVNGETANNFCRCSWINLSISLSLIHKRFCFCRGVYCPTCQAQGTGWGQCLVLSWTSESSSVGGFLSEFCISEKKVVCPFIEKESPVWISPVGLFVYLFLTSYLEPIQFNNLNYNQTFCQRMSAVEMKYWISWSWLDSINLKHFRKSLNSLSLLASVATARI